MLLPENELRERLESPSNLLNRLKSITNPHASNIPSLPPKSGDIIDDLEDKISIGSIKSKASSIMAAAMDELKTRLPEVHKPERLASIAAEMGKVINNIEAKPQAENRTAQIIIYAPQIVSEDTFNVVDLSD